MINVYKNDNWYAQEKVLTNIQQLSKLNLTKQNKVSIGKQQNKKQIQN